MRRARVVDEMVPPREGAIAKWRITHRPSRAYFARQRSLEKRKLQRFSFFISSIKILVILLLAVYAFHFPPAASLPHADVLTVDMTGTKDESRDYLYNLFSHAGLSYVSYNSMSIEELKLLTTGSYRFVLLWGHSAINDVATSEPYSPFYHVSEQLTGQLGKYHVAGKDYFSLQPAFVNELAGRFQGTVVLLMGCNTMTQTELAQAFVNKGASTVIGWRGLVSLSVADTAVTSLFEKVLTQHQTTSQAVSETTSLLNSMGMDTELSAYASV